MSIRNSVVGALTLALVATWTQGCDDPVRVVAIEDAQVVLGDEYCAPMFDCDCEGRRYNEEQDCRDDVNQRIEQVRNAGDAAGLLYDPACIGSFVEQVADRGCGPATVGSKCRVPCNLYIGQAQEGQPCEYLSNGLSNCDQGLTCDGGVCRSPCQRAGRGESCEEALCAEGLLCEFDGGSETPVCVALPVIGQQCPRGECGSGSFCDQPDPMDPSITLCVSLRGDGEGCFGHRECRSGHCPIGKCEPMPLRGQPCPADACADGLECVEGICGDGAPAICYANPPV